MAFANLFTRLAAVEEDVKGPVHPALTDRKETWNGERRGGQKRKNKGKQTGSYGKKPHYQTQTTRANGSSSFRDGNHQAGHSHITFREFADAGFSNKLLHSHIHKTDHNNTPHRGQNNRTKNERNLNQRREQKKTWEQQKHGQKDGRRPAYRSGRPQRAGGGNRKNEDSKVKCKRLMTQEFKNQHAICVGERLICKNFLRGKCTKGDECQLEHVKGFNDLVKESCKFYIQGACMKGESCPYMHNSFPCKFFHRRGKCNQEENCRFSHEPLNELTNKLLDEAIQRENEKTELSKKAKQESSEQPVNSEQTEDTETTKTPDILLQPLRPNFYQSVEINDAEKASSPQTEELPENSDDAVTPHAAQLHSAPSANLHQKEPVCYSVEAVLGPRLSKPLLSFRNQEPAPSCSSDRPQDSATNKRHAPYSVEAVLKSFKPAETPTPAPPPPPSKTVSYSQKMNLKGSSDPSCERQNEQSCSSNKNEGKKFQGKLFQSLPSFQTLANLTSNSRSDLTLPSGELRKQVVNKQDVQKSSGVRESRNVLTDIKHFDSNSEGVDLSGPQQHKTVSSSSCSLAFSSSEHPSALKPHLCVMTPDSRASFQPFTPSLNSSKFKNKDTPAVPVSNPIKSSDSAGFISFVTTKQPAKDTTAHCSGKKADGLSVGGCKLKTSFSSLFAKPLNDSLQREDVLTTSFCPQGLSQSSSPAFESETNCLETSVQPDKLPARSLVSLFAAPLLSLRPQEDPSTTSSALQKPTLKVEAAPRVSDSKQRAASLQTQRQVEADVQTPPRVKGVCHVPTSSHFSPKPKKEHKSSSAESMDQMTGGDCGPVSCSPCEESTPPVIIKTTTHTDHSVPGISPCKEVSPKSILKTLFRRLGPYQQDREQQDPEQKIQVEAEVFGYQQQTRKKRRLKK